MSDITREPAWMCLICGYAMDSTAPADPTVHAAPTEGAIALCMNCGAAYTRRRARWLPMSHEDWASLTDDERADLEQARQARVNANLGDLTRKQGGKA
jgi:hypothetical protein